MTEENKVRSTTILCVKRDGEVVMASDGQVTLGTMVAKGTARKLRLFKKGKIIAGFAGSVADCMTLLDRLETKLEAYDDFMRSCYELAKEWRTDKYIRNLEASIIITDGEKVLELSGDGNILEPEYTNIASVGSGSVFALSAARALYQNTKMSAEEIVRTAMKIAGDLCIYTNHNLSIEKIKVPKKDDKTNDKKEDRKIENKKVKKKQNSTKTLKSKNVKQTVKKVNSKKVVAKKVQKKTEQKSEKEKTKGVLSKVSKIMNTKTKKKPSKK